MSSRRNTCTGSLSIDAATVREMKAQGLGPTAIAKALGVGRASVYRML
jgi:DNA invertase Pin-like site-specific DNA recombinase